MCINIFTEKVMYLCDPDKNYKCPKTSCYIYGELPKLNSCRCTKYAEFAQTYEDGSPIVETLLINGVPFIRAPGRLKKE